MTDEKQQWYVFTFGSGQKHAHRYVKIRGTYEEARQKMVDRYGLSWGFQYSEQERQEWLKVKPYWVQAEEDLGEPLEVIE